MTQLDLDPLIRANLESNVSLMDSVIRHNRKIDYSEIVILKARREKIFRTLNLSRTDYIYLPVGTDFSKYVKFTISDGEYISEIVWYDSKLIAYSWSEQVDSYQLPPLTDFDPFVLRNSKGEIAYVGGKTWESVYPNKPFDYKESDVVKWIRSGILHDHVGYSIVAYPYGLPKIQSLYEWNVLSKMLCVLAKLGYWNMATIHMMDLNIRIDGNDSALKSYYDSITTGLIDTKRLGTGYGLDIQITISGKAIDAFKVKKKGDWHYAKLINDQYYYDLNTQTKERFDSVRSFIIFSMRSVGIDLSDITYRATN